MTTNARRTTALTMISGLGLAALLSACGTSTPDATVTLAPQGSDVTTTAPTTTAATTATTPTTDDHDGATSASSGDDDDVASLANVTVTPESAARTALATVPASQVISIDLDREQGTIVWEVDVVTTGAIREVAVDAATGKVVANRVDDDGDDDLAEAKSLLAAATLTYADALRAATDRVDDGRVVEIDLDDDDDKIVWDVDVIGPDHTEHELTIDAKTGAITEHERG